MHQNYTQRLARFSSHYVLGGNQTGARIGIHSAFGGGDSLPQVSGDEDVELNAIITLNQQQKNIERDSKMISWNFPGNQDGQVKGVADAGIENFNGTELSSLARENCQNSLDAALDDSNPDVQV